MCIRLASIGVVLLASATATHAQSFNVDMGSTTSGFGVPSATYGAGANQPGPWNAYNGTVPFLPLVDTSGNATAATLTENHFFAMSSDNSPTTFGDDEALLDDYENLGPIGLGSFWTFQNLQSGSYALYTYGWGGEASSGAAVGGVPGVCGNSLDPEQNLGGHFTGQHQLGVTYALHHLDVPSGGAFCIQVRSFSGHARLNGFQLVRTGPVQLAVFCSGDGSATACPCGNVGAEGRGCANSVQSGGASLWVTGIASVSNDGAYFDVQWMPDSAALLIQGSTRIASGAGAVFGDGLRCVGGTVHRISAHNATGGNVRWPSGSELPVSFQGGAIAGSTLHYQAWYRNAATYCTSSTFNLTNGVSVNWLP